MPARLPGKFGAAPAFPQGGRCMCPGASFPRDGSENRSPTNRTQGALFAPQPHNPPHLSLGVQEAVCATDDLVPRWSKWQEHPAHPSLQATKRSAGGGGADRTVKGNRWAPKGVHLQNPWWWARSIPGKVISDAVTL